MEPAKILVVDDERSILVLLKEALGQWGYLVTTAASAAEALGILKSELFDALITDIRMPDMSGLELLREVKKQDESIEVVMMTGYPTIASAVQALKEGAYDYLSKPLILDELRHLMSRMMERKFLRGEIHTLRARLGEELTVNELIGTSVPMERVKEIIGKVAVTDSPVLIEGESGTGKELVAAAIHRLSSRAKRPFIPVNCSAIPQDLLESEFFGDVRGVAPEALAALSAYTFPGNVRELENLIERAFAMGSREQISLTDLPSLSKTPMASTPVTSPESVPALADVERELILKALAVFKDDKEAAAKALGISRRTIYRRLKEYGVL